MKKVSIPRVAILIDPAFGWGRSIIDGILAYTNNIAPWHIHFSPSLQLRQLTHLPNDWKVDGIIATVDCPQLAQTLKRTGLPIVNVADISIKGFVVPNVRTDDRASTQLAAEHFIRRGFNHLAFVGSSANENAKHYGEAFANALIKRNISAHIYPVDTYSPGDRTALIQWLKNLPKPVGILVWGAGNSQQVVDCCLEAGLSVPHDVSVLSGNYDPLMNRACFPPVSGIELPTRQIGYKAANLLHALLQKESVPAEITWIAPSSIKEELSTETLAVEDPRIVRAVQFIQDHAFHSISMKDIMKEVPMSQRALERQFFQLFGHTPIEEIKCLRINKARKLLAETDLPMQLIAEACGYATYNYLSIVFKKTTGTTPRDYRKEHHT